MHVNNPRRIDLTKVMYHEREFYLIPSSVLTVYDKIEMARYVKAIGDTAFIVDNEMYFDEGAYFNLTMKYCDKYVFI
ncbi:hypothetical protein pEaSNUABM44_00073 [Erwinia phage pEa_SNUABM_44]|nr:hypothetical protein pEaSNUABM44_00073 [Erwinia phage pEa_SNUABM_44]